MNAVKMRNYRANLSGEKGEAYLKKERMRQAQIRLERKCVTEIQRERNRLHQQKNHLLKSVPTSPSKFKRVFKALCKVASSSPQKQEIMNTCLGYLNSLLKLQHQRNPNCLLYTFKCCEGKIDLSNTRKLLIKLKKSTKVYIKHVDI